MCVILVCPPKVRPGIDVIQACHEANPHGAGVAWREKKEVRWIKNLDPDEVGSLLCKLKGEVVIHFRWASVGGINPRLCHPFPVDHVASTKLEGRAPRVLFHNGTWNRFNDALAYIEQEQARRVKGPISDTRVAALLVDHFGDPALLKRMGGRFVLFTPKETKFFGSWQKWRRMKCSNLGFLYELERANRPVFKKAGTDQMILWGEGGEE